VEGGVVVEEAVEVDLGPAQAATQAHAREDVAQITYAYRIAKLPQGQ